MHCVNHPGVEVQSYCQNCGKPLCESCVRKTASGQILCESCFAATAGDPAKAQWQGVNVPPGQVPLGQAPFYPFAGRGPNPGAAAVLGLIPGVGAMYNGQLFKGLIHVVVFAVLVSITDRYAIFLIFVFAWCLYQSFEAFHTAKARRDGLPVPDPFGLNELGSWINLGTHNRPTGTGTTGTGPVPTQGYPASGSPAGPGAVPEPPPYNAPYTSSWTAGTSGASPTGEYVNPQQPYAEPYAGQPPYAGQVPYTENYPPGSYPPGFVPPIPPVPPMTWRRKEPVFAFVLIALGVIFLLQSMGIVSHVLHYIWPFMLIGMGIWLFLRRTGDAQGGSK